MSRIPHRPLPLVLLMVGAAGCAAHTSQSSGSTTADPSSGGGGSSLLAAETTPLAGDALRAHLPRGTVTPEAADPAVAQPGMLIQSVHVVARPSGNLRITAKDIGKSAGDDFRTRIVENERRARCAAEGDAVDAASATSTPGGLDVVVFTPESACQNATPPAARLWLKSTDASVFSITFECEADGCMPDREALLEAFIGSITPGTPTPTPAGPRTLGPSSDVTLTVTLPEGFLVRGSQHDQSTMYEVFRRHALGEPSEGVSFTFLGTASPNSLRDDYAREGVRPRMVQGTLAGHRTRFLDQSYAGTMERDGRIDVGAGHLDVVARAASQAALDELMGIVSGATLSSGGH